ncbi:MAG TPA: hypothetical protein VIH21_03125 [Dehalococcoidia bacterium]|jgi:hypothetical protein
MPTYVSILNWSGDPLPTAAEVRAAIDGHGAALIRQGLHSLAFLPDEGDCAAIMVATCRDDISVERLAASIVNDAKVHVESMVFDDDPGTPAWIAKEEAPPPPFDFHRALLDAIVVDG